MNETLHRNYRVASNLILCCVPLSIINTIILTDGDPTGTLIFIVVITVLVALLVRAGYSWMKWVLLIIGGIGILFEPFILMDLMWRNGAAFIINIAQTVLEIIAIVKLFGINDGPEKPGDNEEGDETEVQEDTYREIPVHDAEMPENYGL